MSFNIPVALCIMTLWFPFMRYFISYLITHPRTEQTNWMTKDTWVKALAITMIVGITFPGMIIGILVRADTFIDSSQDPSLLTMLIISAAVNIYCLVHMVKYKEVKNVSTSTFGYLFPIFTVVLNLIQSHMFTI